MSESLAHGLFSQMSRRTDEEGRRAHERHPRPEPGAKRASAYRAARKWMHSVLLPEQFLGEVAVGDQSGKDKNAGAFILHWDTNPLCDVGCEHLPADLVLFVTAVTARHARIDHLPLATFSRHALMRLFYRLKTTSSARVLEEVADMARLLFHWQSAFSQMSPDAQVLLPSRSGAFAVTWDRPTFQGFIVKTWMDDNRMRDNTARQSAVGIARREHGFVINDHPVFPVISERRVWGEERKHHLEVMNILPDVLNAAADAQYPHYSCLRTTWRFTDRTANTQARAMAARHALAAQDGDLDTDLFFGNSLPVAVAVAAPAPAALQR